MSDVPPEPRRSGLLGTVRAVAASFFGVRGRKAHEDDLARLNPVHVILVGVAMAVVFVVVLILIAKAVVSGAAA